MAFCETGANPKRLARVARGAAASIRKLAVGLGLAYDHVVPNDEYVCLIPALAESLADLLPASEERLPEGPESWIR